LSSLNTEIFLFSPLSKKHLKDFHIIRFFTEREGEGKVLGVFNFLLSKNKTSFNSIIISLEKREKALESWADELIIE